MKKKAVIISVVAVAVIALITVAILVLSKEKQNPEEILKTYFAYIEKQNYEEMYNMISEYSKTQISKISLLINSKK